MLFGGTKIMRHNCPPDDPVDPEVDRIWSPEHLLPGHLDFTLMCFVWTFLLVFARLASFLSTQVVKKKSVTTFLEAIK